MGNDYIFDLHVHTAQGSECAELGGAGLVEKYRALGYDGFVVTDHMKSGDRVWKGLAPWRKKADQWLAGYHAARAAAGDDFTVLLGLEIRFLENHNDYLLFGVTEDFVRQTPDLHRFPSLRAFRPVAEAHGLLIVQAHPFRVGMTVMPHGLLDGMEIHNGGFHVNQDGIAAQWAADYDLIPTAGSDYHGYDRPHRHKPGMDPSEPYKFRGIRTQTRPQSSQQLAEILRARAYSLVPQLDGRAKK
ncbi:MAG: PHP domain-containing protein [Oscillospiraceae bacterium]|jgi:hypothetical protein|nr:PHP domain-containing protein [Oscillospiraceae bacterium]